MSKAEVELYYFRGRGLGEPVRFMLAAAGVQYKDCFVEEKDQLERLRENGELLFNQLPLLKIDGIK